jgi:4-amino-4-deoxy-L-arabinose transferase-like glycosyltransferase
MTDHADRPTRRVTQVCSLTAIALSILAVAVYLFIAASRLRYPFELEWLEGLSLQHVKRVLGQGDLYTQPSIDFVPNIYPPLHAYIGAIASALFGAHFTTLRAISLLSSLGILVMIHRFVARETSTQGIVSNVPAMVAVGLFAATFDRVGGWFDIARIDSLFLLFVMIGFYVQRFYPSSRGLIVAGIFYVAAGFVKQSAFVMAAPIILALIGAHGYRGGYFAGSVGGVAAVVTLVLASVYEGSWFFYYVIDMPLRHPKIQVSSFAILWSDLLAPMPIACLLALVSLLPGDPHAPKHRSLILGAFLAGGVVIFWMVRSRVGTFLNDIIPAYLAVAVLAGIGIERILRIPRDLKGPSFVPGAALALTIIQFWLLRYDPLVHIPSHEDREAGERIVAQLRSIPGEIFLPHHGYLAEMAGKRSFAHTLAIDNIRSEDPGPYKELLERQMLAGLAQKRFGAVIVESDGWGLGSIQEYYRPARSLHLNSGIFYPREGGHLRPETIFVPKSTTDEQRK